MIKRLCEHVYVLPHYVKLYMLYVSLLWTLNAERRRNSVRARSRRLYRSASKPTTLLCRWIPQGDQLYARTVNTIVLALTFRVCRHSNETRTPIANPPDNAQLRGTPYHSSKLHPYVYSSGGMRRGTDRHTDGATNIHCEPKKGGSTFGIMTLEKHARFL